jgi:hypothetical protein
MSDADKLPAQPETVQGKDSFTGWIGEAMKIAQQVADNEARAQERARLRALVQAECDRLGRQCVPTRVPFEEGRIAALHHVLTMISLEETSHE